MATHPTTESTNLEFGETLSVTLEWKISGLKDIFEKSKGEVKSKCIKSAVFGDPDNLWEVIFYPNSGSPNTSINQNPLPGAPSNGIGEYSSFYLSAVPTDEEKAHGIKGKWARKGLFAFRFEVKTKTGTVLTAKEAANHVFSSKTVNWGWQSFARRDTLFYQAPVVRGTDSFIITCTVSSAACPPAGTWLNLYGCLPAGASAPANVFAASGTGWKGSEGGWKGLGGGNGAMAGARKLVPKSVVHSFGSLFDDETYSDVEFWLPSRRRRSKKARVGDHGDREDPSIRSGIQDKEHEFTTTNTNTTTALHITSPSLGGTSPVTGLSNDAETLSVLSPSNNLASLSTEREMMAEESNASRAAVASEPYYRKIWANKKLLRRGEFFNDLLFGGFAEGSDPPSRPESPGADSDLYGWDDSDIAEEMQSDSEDDDKSLPKRPAAMQPSSNGPRKTKIVIRDAAYSTWQALIYYLYTDEITFAPLSSSFIPSGTDSAGQPVSATSSAFSSRQPTAASLHAAMHDNGISGRKEWIKAWAAERAANGDWPANAPRPCSAKAIFRLADKLDLPALRQRAFQHIISQLTIQNVANEAFSQFSSTYDEVRQVETSFFLQNWNEIKTSHAMRNIWSELRLGKHQGFEKVWPYILSQLQFVPSKPVGESVEGGAGAGVHFNDF